MPDTVYHPNAPGDQQFLPASGTQSVTTTQKNKGDDSIKPSSGTLTKKVHQNALGDQQWLGPNS